MSTLPHGALVFVGLPFGTAPVEWMLLKHSADGFETHLAMATVSHAPPGHTTKGTKGETVLQLRFQWVKNMRSIATRLRRPCSVSTTEHLLLHWEGSRGPYLERIGLAGICTRQQSRQSRTRQGTTVLKSEIIQKQRRQCI